MADAWSVLVVDDENDVHSVTTLALKRKLWRGRPIALTHAKSAAEAMEYLLSRDRAAVHCALVDVVMESNDAGLKLCDFIREKMPQSTRIILRTGQAGLAPAEQVMNDYDIDYYLAEAELTDAAQARGRGRCVAGRSHPIRGREDSGVLHWAAALRPHSHRNSRRLGRSRVRRRGEEPFDVTLTFRFTQEWHGRASAAHASPDDVRFHPSELLESVRGHYGEY
jgi:CheY-like chemotaxis protein